MSTVFGPVYMEDQYKCDVFVIMPFKDEFRDVFDHAIKEACEQLGLSVKLGDDFSSNKQIISEIWSALNNCQLVIADCTEQNANVFYELGIAHCLEKNTIQITKEQQNVPFDIRGRRYISYSTANFAAQKKLISDLKEAIIKILNLTPVSAVMARNPASTHYLQLKDPKRFGLSKSGILKVLREESDRARKLDEYEWMELFAEEWVRIAPGESRAYEDLGEAFIRSSQPEKAIPIAEKLIELDKLNYNGYEILGEAYSLLGQWGEARKWQEIALNYAPKTFKRFILIDLSETYEALGLLDEAIVTLEKLIPLLDDSFMKQFHTNRLERLRDINKE